MTLSPQRHGNNGFDCRHAAGAKALADSIVAVRSVWPTAYRHRTIDECFT
jgi:hypothetical protein